MSTRRYAEGTAVSVDRSRAEIQKLLERNGATSSLFGTTSESIMIMFEMQGFRVRFVVPMPVARRGTTEAKAKAETRRRWRAMLLVLKAKLEAVSSGIVEFPTEFLAHIMVTGNETVGDQVVPKLSHAISAGKVTLPLLLGPGTSPASVKPKE